MFWYFSNTCGNRWHDIQLVSSNRIEQFYRFNGQRITFGHHDLYCNRYGCKRLYQPCDERGNRPCLTDNYRYPYSHGYLQWPQYKPYCFRRGHLFLVAVNRIKQFHRVNCKCIAFGHHDIYCNRY